MRIIDRCDSTPRNLDENKHEALRGQRQAAQAWPFPPKYEMLAMATGIRRRPFVATRLVGRDTFCVGRPLAPGRESTAAP